jgi:hypothetical protein
MLTDILDNVVAKRILHECKSICSDLGNQPCSLLTRGVINTALENTAAMTVSTNCHTVVSNSVVDELV